MAYSYDALCARARKKALNLGEDYGGCFRVLVTEAQVYFNLARYAGEVSRVHGTLMHVSVRQE